MVKATPAGAAHATAGVAQRRRLAPAAPSSTALASPSPCALRALPGRASRTDRVLSPKEHGK
eukprot:1960354-Pleurochrysis_carterae.AAC.1